jgi:hypothetical protein
MPSKKKDIGMGLLVGMAIGALLMGGLFLLADLVPLPEFEPALVQELIFAPEKVSAQAPAKTSFATPTAPVAGGIPLSMQATLTPTPVFIDPTLITGNPLTGEEQAQLHVAAFAYVSTDYATLKANGEEINGKGYGHPSNICGPLSIAILQDAHILSRDVVPYDFWLLNPDVYENRVRLAETFPEERFEVWRDKRPLNEISWTAFPLMPGDFLYLFSGSRGNFEHMLVVTRVDEAGRAYSVTNHQTEEGFIVTEELLYDPNSPGEGLFYQWTEREKALLGSTGFNGFQLWRLRER